jgi:hypothetical protein
MAEIFHGSMTVNSNTGDWLALPALPAGVDPRRRVMFRSNAICEIGWCTAGQSTQDAGTMTTAGASTFYAFARDFGVVDYNRLTARANAGSQTVLYVYSISPTDEGPRSF